MAQVAETVKAQDKRLFISGVAPSLRKDELKARLSTYGVLTKDLVLNEKNAQTTGIFGHCNLSLTANAWSRLRKLSGTVLKGSKLKIEEAKADWSTIKALDQARPQPIVPNARKRPPPGTTPAVESKRVKRGDVVKDSSISQKSRKQGWIKGRYGRAIAILKSENGVKLSRNPDALSRLWGAAHPRPDQLTAEYDDAEDQWHDRRGRVIRETEVTKKRQTVETRQGGRVEVWGSDDEVQEENVDYTVSTSERLDYKPADNMDSEPEIDEAQLDAQLLQERSAGLSLLGDMFKDSEAIDIAAQARKEKRKVRDKLDIVKRFDPNAPESASEVESDIDLDVPTHEAVYSPEEHMPDDSQPQDTSADIAIANEHGSNDEEKADDVRQGEEGASVALPAMLNLRTDVVNNADLTSIFKLRSGDAKQFSLFEAPHESEEDDEEDEDRNADRDPSSLLSQGIHPDRLNRSALTESYHEDVEGNANYTALAKDRGFNMSTIATNETFPLLLSDGSGSFWHNQSDFFGEILDTEAIKRRWEESRGDITRDWKRKRREGTKKLRKAHARQGH